MELLLIGFVWVLNFAISWWNAYVCGKAWAESKAVGGWHRFMVWIGAIMSAAGFTWCYLIFEALTAYHFGFIDAYWMGITLQLGYVILVPVILFGSYAITLDSWARAISRGGILNYGVAAYNSYATYHNTYHAVNGFGKALGNVAEAFSGGGGSSRSSSSNSKGKGEALMLLFVILLVALALIFGILTTTLIIKRTAAADELMSRDEMERRRALAGR